MKRAYGVPKDVIRIIVSMDQQERRKKLEPFIERLCGGYASSFRADNDLTERWNYVSLAMKFHYI